MDKIKCKWLMRGEGAKKGQEGKDGMGGQQRGEMYGGRELRGRQNFNTITQISFTISRVFFF